MFITRLTASLWDKTQKAMPVLMFIGMAGLLLVPPISGITWGVFVKYMQAVTGGSFAWAVPLAIALLLVDIQINNRLEALNQPLLEKSLFKFKGNSAYQPILKYKRLGGLYVILLGLCMPLLALIEEWLFREMAAQFGVMVLVLVSGPVFGLVHLSAGANLRRVICMTGLSLALASVYLTSGLMGAFALHASYNLIVLVWLSFDTWVKPRLPDSLRVDNRVAA